MKETTIFIAPLGARNKKEKIFEEVVSSCPRGDYSSVLYITPTAFGQTEVKRQFFSYLKNKHKKTSYIPFHSIPLKQLCIDLYETYPLPEKGRCPNGGFRPSGESVKRIISANIEPLLLCGILKEKNLGYALILSELLYKLRHYVLNKPLSQIKEEIKQLIFEEKAMKRAIDALEILENYEKMLEGKGLIDYESALRESVSLINEHLNPSLLVLDGFFDPTPLELEIIKAIIEKADKVCVLVEEEAEFLRFFESSEASPIRKPDPLERTFLMGQGLRFLSKGAGRKWEVRSERLEKAISQRKGTGYYSYPSMEDEVEGIAKGVKSLILEGTKPWEIIVSFPVLSRYIPMLKRVFQKHQIPLNIAEYDLSNARPIVALEDMIASIEDDYPRNDFLSFLTSTYFPKIPEVLKEWAVVYSRRAGIVKGKQAWLLIKDILFNSTEEEISEYEKNLISEIQKGIKSVIEVLEGIRQAGDSNSYIDRLEDALNRFGFLDSLEESLLETVNNQFAELRHFAKGFGSSLNGIEAGHYLRHLLKGLRGRDEGEGGVRVVPYEFAAGIESKAMFFGGVVEGDFPSKPDIDPILPERVKKALGIPFLEYYLDRQKRYFKRLLNVSADEPYFSYFSADGDKVFLPSPFLEWGQSLIPPALNIPTEEDILTAEGLFSQKNFTEILWDGELPKEKATRNLLTKYFGSESTRTEQDIFIRVTDIDAYRKCPLRFYIEKVLGLEIEKPPRFEVEARLWGRFAHKVMEYLYKDGDIDLKDINKRIMGGLEHALKSREIGTIGDFWSRVAREIFLRLIPMIEEQEMDIRMQGFSPYMVEKGIKAEINGLKLKGKIDRIDIRKSQISNLKSQREVRLLDYKTGSIDKDSLQLPLYAAMWQEEQRAKSKEQRAKSVVEKVGFYSLRDGSVEWYPPKKLSMEEFIQEALQITEEIVQKMREGIFMPIPFKDTECRHCYHSALCKGGK